MTRRRGDVVLTPDVLALLRDTSYEPRGRQMALFSVLYRACGEWLHWRALLRAVWPEVPVGRHAGHPLHNAIYYLRPRIAALGLSIERSHRYGYRMVNDAE